MFARDQRDEHRNVEPGTESEWRVTELYGAQWRRRRRRCREDCISEIDRLEDWTFRDCEGADTAYVGARRPCKALLGQRVHKRNARNVIARPITA